MRTAQPEYFELLTHSELIAINQDLSPQATLKLSMPSTLQQSETLNVTLQACDSSRGDQLFVPRGGAAPGNMSMVSSKYGSMCLTSTQTGALVASPCGGSSSPAAQTWGISQDSHFHVVQQPPTAPKSGSCLGGSLSLEPCIYTGPLPPPFNLALGEQLWVWDRKGSIIHGSTGSCLTLGLPNFNPTGGSYVTNNGTLQAEVWTGPLSTPNKKVLVLFNKSPLPDTLNITWDVLGLPAGASLPVRDVYAKADLPLSTSLSALVGAHGVRVFTVG